ncbi:hypothetical protein ES703_61934 [subsurface metagenome]
MGGSVTISAGEIVGLPEAIFGKTQPRCAVELVGQRDRLFAERNRLVRGPIKIHRRRADCHGREAPVFVSNSLRTSLRITAKGKPLFDVAQRSERKPCLDAQIDRVLLPKCGFGLLVNRIHRELVIPGGVAERRSCKGLLRGQMTVTIGLPPVLGLGRVVAKRLSDVFLARP